MPVPIEVNAPSVHVGSHHACSLGASGIALCWGDNSAGQLGVPSGATVVGRVVVSGGMRFNTLTLGERHTCGLTFDGAAYCWGDPVGGRLGGGQRSGFITTPELVSGSHQFASLSAGGETTCGATDAGHVYCWGRFGLTVGPISAETCTEASDKGSTRTYFCSHVPVRMSLVDVLAADSFFEQVSGKCARTSLGTVFCHDAERAAFVRRQGFGPFATIERNCGLTTLGAAWCWGSNSRGQLGDGTTQNRAAPVAVVGGHTFTQLAGGADHTCGLTAAGEVWCWGLNNLGQTGTSILRNPVTPVRVRGQG